MSVQTTVPAGHDLRAFPQHSFLGPSPDSNYVAVHAQPAFSDILDVLEAQCQSGAGEVQSPSVGPKSGLHALYQGLKAAMPQDCPAPEELQHFVRDGRRPSYWSFVLNNASRLPGWQAEEFRTSSATLSQVAMAALKLQDALVAAGNAAKFHLIWLKEHDRAEDYGRDTFELVPALDVSRRQPGDVFVFVVARDFAGDHHRQYAPIVAAGGLPATGLAQVVANTATDPYDGFATKTIAGNKKKMAWPSGFLPSKLTTLWLAGKLAMDPASRVPHAVTTPMQYTEIANCLGVQDVSTIRKKGQHGRIEAEGDQALRAWLVPSRAPPSAAANLVAAAAAANAAPAPPAAPVAPAAPAAPAPSAGSKRPAAAMAEDNDDDDTEEERPATRLRTESPAPSSGLEDGAEDADFLPWSCPAVEDCAADDEDDGDDEDDEEEEKEGEEGEEGEEEVFDLDAWAAVAANTAGAALDDLEVEAAVAAAAG